MRSVLAVITLTITGTCFWQTNGKANEKSASDEQSIMQIEQDMVASLQKGDASPFEKYLADTYVFTGTDGAVMDKTQLVSDIKSGDLKIESSKLDDMKVRVYGDTAVATYG